MNHYFDADGFYTHSLPTGKGHMPRNARRKALPEAPWGEAWPRWNGVTWELAERPHAAVPDADAPAPEVAPLAPSEAAPLAPDEAEDQTV